MRLYVRSFATRELKSYENKTLMETEKLNDNEVREIAQMQKIIDTLESAIASLHETAKGNKNAVYVIFDTFDTWGGQGLFERMYNEILDKLIELQDGKSE